MTRFASSTCCRPASGSGHGGARVRRRARDPAAGGRGARHRDADARASLAADRLERDGGRDPLRAVADRPPRRLRPGGAGHRLRPDADRKSVLVAFLVVGGSCTTTCSARGSSASSARATRRLRPPGAASSSSGGSTSASRSPCRSSAAVVLDDATTRWPVDDAARHLALLTRTIEVVNSSLDLQEVLEAIAHEVAAALETDACFVYLYDERADELVLRATHGTRVEETTRAADAAGRGDHRRRCRRARADHDPASAHLDPRFKDFPNLPEDEYESILAVPILAGDELEGALNVRTREPRAFTDAEIELLDRDRLAGRAVDRAREALRPGAAPGARARGARADLRGGVGVALPRGVARGDRRRRRWSRSTRPARRSCSRTGGSPGPRAAPARTRCGCRCAGAAARSASSSSTATRRSPTRTAQLLDAIAHQAAVALEHGRAVMRGVLAQEIHHRVKNNLQTVASLLRLQARADDVDPRKALGDSVNRILAIAAVHEVLTEHREDDVDLAELIDRLRAMLVQGLVAGKEVEARARAGLARGPARDGARARLQRAARRTRSSTAATDVSIELRAAGATSCSRSPTTAPASTAPATARAVDRPGARARRAGGTLELGDRGGLRAEVRFPA